MIKKYKKQISDLKYSSTRVEMLSLLALLYGLKGELSKAHNYLRKYLMELSNQYAGYVKARYLKDYALYLLNFHEKGNVRELINLVIANIDVQTYKAKVKLKNLSGEIKVGNISIATKLINDLSGDINFMIENELDKNQGMLDSIIREFISIVLEFSVFNNTHEYLGLCIRLRENVNTLAFRDAITRDIINCYYELAIKQENDEFANKASKLRDDIKDLSYKIETYQGYTSFLRFKEPEQEIENTIKIVIDGITKIEGNFSRSAAIQAAMKIIENLHDNSLIEKYIKLISEINEKYQDIFCSVLNNIQFVHSCLHFGRIDDAKLFLQKAVSSTFLINDNGIFIKVYEKILYLLLNLSSQLTGGLDNIINELFNKVKNIRELGLKIYMLIKLNSILKSRPDISNQIEDLLVQNRKPYIMANLIIDDHVILVQEFIIEKIFQKEDFTLALNKAFNIIKNYQDPRHKFKLMLRVLEIIKKSNNLKMFKKLESNALAYLNLINNEYERIEMIKALILLKA
ncbi:MAG: hypothetical protein ACTSYS_02250 [Promethearchaeota archaeon]